MEVKLQKRDERGLAAMRFVSSRLNTIAALALALFLQGCGDNDTDESESADKKRQSGEKNVGKRGAEANKGSKCANHRPPPRPPETLPSVARIMPEWARSLKVMQKLTVHEKPDTTSEEMGEIKMVSRLPLLPYKPPGNGCSKFWLKLEPGAWVCGDHLRKDRRPPLMKIQPLMDGDMMPGKKYAMVRSGGAKTYASRADVLADKPKGKLRASTIIRWLDTVSLGGEPVWWISKKVYVKASRLLRHYPSKFQGINLREKGWDLPVCIVRAATRGAPVYAEPKETKPITRVGHHTKWRILDKTRTGETKFYKIKPGWIPARRVISAWPTKPPPGLKECEKWIELVVAHQSIVAYEGTEPVYMTMVSSGDRRYPTDYGIFRVWWKKAQADMSSSMGGSGEFYRVDDVAWAVFFWRGEALHAAHWHDDFGTRRSHGCVNLAPKDAKWFYDWTEPRVPPAWLNRRANERHPGTIVRVRHKVTHKPPFHGYSRKLAPEEAVRALDEARKERMRKKSLRILKQKQGD
jgi:lipoprotein-anchoring transpeptidase ErfK/SrfK